MKTTVYLDSECLMCTEFGKILKRLKCKVDVKTNKTLSMPGPVIENTIVCFDFEKGAYYFEFFAIFFILSKSDYTLLRVIFLTCFFILNLVSLKYFYDFISKNRMLLFKEKQYCNLDNDKEGNR